MVRVRNIHGVVDAPTHTQTSVFVLDSDDLWSWPDSWGPAPWIGLSVDAYTQTDEFTGVDEEEPPASDEEGPPAGDDEGPLAVDEEGPAACDEERLPASDEEGAFGFTDEEGPPPARDEERTMATRNWRQNFGLSVQPLRASRRSSRPPRAHTVEWGICRFRSPEVPMVGGCISLNRDRETPLPGLHPHPVRTGLLIWSECEGDRLARC